MTFYWGMNINTWNGHKTNELVSFNVLFVTIYKRCQIVTTKLTKLTILKNI